MATRRWAMTALLGLGLTLAGLGTACADHNRRITVENAFVGRTEASVLAELGNPTDSSSGHYGAPSATFTERFGTVKTLRFVRSGGALYVTFEDRDGRWMAICSSWLPEGSMF